MNERTLTYKGYGGSVEVSSDGGFSGKVLGIRCGLIYEAQSFSELQDAFQHVIDAYLEYCEIEKIEPEKQFRGRPPFSSHAVQRTKLCKPFDAVDYLETEEDCALYFQSCVEEDPGDGSLKKAALLDLEKAGGRKNESQKTCKEILERDFGGLDERS